MKSTKSFVIISSLFAILFLIGLGIFIYIWFGGDDSPEWKQDIQSGMSLAVQENRPIVLAVVKASCNLEENSTCPNPNQNPNLKDFVLLEVYPNTPEYRELSYDDRYVSELDHLPKFFLLNPDGEIRDIQSEFPDKELLLRWKEIR